MINKNGLEGGIYKEVEGKINRHVDAVSTHRGIRTHTCTHMQTRTNAVASIHTNTNTMNKKLLPTQYQKEKKRYSKQILRRTKCIVTPRYQEKRKRAPDAITRFLLPP